MTCGLSRHARRVGEYLRAKGIGAHGRCGAVVGLQWVSVAVEWGQRGGGSRADAEHESLPSSMAAVLTPLSCNLPRGPLEWLEVRTQKVAAW